MRSTVEKWVFPAKLRGRKTRLRRNLVTTAFPLEAYHDPDRGSRSQGALHRSALPQLGQTRGQHGRNAPGHDPDGQAQCFLPKPR